MSNQIPPDVPSFEDIPEMTHKEHVHENRPTPTPRAPIRDSVSRVPPEDGDIEMEKANKRNILKEEADSVIKKLQYLKQIAKTLAKDKFPELQALIGFEKKLELILTKHEIIQQKIIKMSNQLEVYHYEMSVAIEKLNTAIATYNKLPITPDTAAAFQAACDAFRTATSAATQTYQKAAGIYNAVVMTVPGVNVQLATLKLPRISPNPVKAPPPIAYAPPTPAAKPVQPLPALPPFTPLVQINPPLSRAKAIEISLGSAIQSLFSEIAQPLDIQKHMDRHV